MLFGDEGQMGSGAVWTVATALRQSRLEGINVACRGYETL